MERGCALLFEQSLNIVFIVFGIGIAVMIPSQVPQTATNLAMGPGFFPTFAAALMILVNGLSLVMNYMHYAKDKAKGVKEELVQKTASNDQIRVLIVLAIIAVYIFFMPIIGYIISTAWKRAGKINIGNILLRSGYNVMTEIPDYWYKDSVEKGYLCPQCGNPCHCSCVIFEKFL